jgi:hypothetical protein
MIILRHWALQILTSGMLFSSGGTAAARAAAPDEVDVIFSSSYSVIDNIEPPWATYHNPVAAVQAAKHSGEIDERMRLFDVDMKRIANIVGPQVGATYRLYTPSDPGFAEKRQAFLDGKLVSSRPSIYIMFNVDIRLKACNPAFEDWGRREREKHLCTDK